MVAPDQLDEDRFLGIEVVIETSGRMPAASAICWSEVRRPEVAMTAFAVFRIWVRRVASGFNIEKVRSSAIASLHLKKAEKPSSLVKTDAASKFRTQESQNIAV